MLVCLVLVVIVVVVVVVVVVLLVAAAATGAVSRDKMIHSKYDIIFGCHLFGPT